MFLYNDYATALSNLVHSLLAHYVHLIASQTDKATIPTMSYLDFKKFEWFEFFHIPTYSSISDLYGPLKCLIEMFVL